MTKYKGYILILSVIFSIFQISAQPIMENLNRGAVAVKSDTGVFISWRLLANDPDNVSFNVYSIDENGKENKLNNQLLVEQTNFFVNKTSDKQYSKYKVKAFVGKKEQKGSEIIDAWEQNYHTINLQTPKNYRPGDASVGDLDGDGEYEIIIHMTGRGRDNSHLGPTSEPIIHAYKMDGTLLWEINLGENIREGSHYTQFLVYDFNGDGKSEIVCKTADGTIDGIGNVIGNADSVYVEPKGATATEIDRKGNEVERNVSGFIISGPEYLSVFDGQSGKVLSTVDYIPPRYPDKLYPTGIEMQKLWGDGRANRSDRFLATVAYLDGVNPSIVMCRGYYTRTVLAAWDFKDGELKNKWVFDSHDGNPENKKYAGQGNHSVSVGDVDNDGKDEIVYGACVIDDDGTGLYSTGFGHGDALHFSDLDPLNPGLEIFNIQERFDDAGMNFREAGSGKVLWKKASVLADDEGGDKGEGPGRAVAFNVDPRYAGNECWVRGAELHGIYSAKGELIDSIEPNSCNFGIWWDGDLLREILDRNYVGKWNWEESRIDTVMVADNCWSNNGTKSTPVLSGDLFGDWREEVIFRTRDNQSIRIYTTTIPTEHCLYTLMHDPIYRLSIAWQNVAYNQPPHPSFYIGDEMEKQKKPNVSFLSK